MAELAHKVMQTESLITPPESSPATGTRKSKAKRSRPKKADTSLTRTTRRVARSKSGARSKAAPPTTQNTALNRLLNFSVVIAVFVTALAIQRIVPTEPVTALKVEALPLQITAAPVAPAPAPDTAPVAVIASPALPMSAPAATVEPQKAAAIAQKPTPAPQQIAKKPKVATPRIANIPQTHATSLNSGGAEDLDSESARQTYISRSKLATRTPAK